MTAYQSQPVPHARGHRRRHGKDAQLKVWFMTDERPGAAATAVATRHARPGRLRRPGPSAPAGAPAAATCAPRS